MLRFPSKYFPIDKIKISQNFFCRGLQQEISAVEKDSSIGTYIYMEKILEADFIETGFSQ